MITKYHTRTPLEDVRARNLSSSQQQKVVIVRELDPELVLDIAAHSIRGLGQGAVSNVHHILMKKRKCGATVLSAVRRLIPGYLRAYKGVNEVKATIMTSYIAI